MGYHAATQVKVEFDYLLEDPGQHGALIQLQVDPLQLAQHQQVLPHLHDRNRCGRASKARPDQVKEPFLVAEVQPQYKRCFGTTRGSQDSLPSKPLITFLPL